ncbi:MAG: hypothetical protein ACJ73S_08375 [Mycobacteriales bacterium]
MSLDGLDTAVRDASEDAGTSRARQLRWVAGELRLAEEHGLLAGAWYAAGPVAAYLGAAARGELRRRTARREPSTPAAMAVRRDCLVRLIKAAGRPVPELPSPGDHTPPEPVPKTSAAIMLGHLLDRATRHRNIPALAREAATAALVFDTGARPGELAALTTEDLELATDHGRVRLSRRAPGQRRAAPPVWYPLSPTAREALALWLQTRAEVVLPRVRALFVSVAANHDGAGRTLPPGLPLQPRGLQRAHTRAVLAANADLLGQPGFAPVPVAFGPLGKSLQAS